jgi:hypothetical protein
MEALFRRSTDRLMEEGTRAEQYSSAITADLVLEALDAL